MKNQTRVVFISGGNRGIGFGLTLELSRRGYQVVAGYRNESRSQDLLKHAESSERVNAFRVDVTRESDLKQLHDFISDSFGSLDLLINNAGVNLSSSARLQELMWSEVEESFRVNLGGPFLTTKYLYPLVKSGRDKKIVNLSSQMASNKLSSGSATPYRVSKAALSMLTRNQSIEYKAAGVTVVAVNPGWVKTDMGGDSAPLSVEESVTKMLALLEKISLRDTGKLLSLDGEVIPY